MRAIPHEIRSALSFALVALVFLIAAVYFLTTPASVANVPASAAAASKSAANVPASAATASKSTAAVPADTVAASNKVAAAPAGAAASSKAAAAAPASAAAAPKNIVVAQNLCVHGADGAIVCGPPANRGVDAPPSPFDRPGGAKPIELAPSVAEPGPMPRRAARRVERHVGPARHVYRPPPPREFESHPPRRTAREDARRWYHEDARHVQTVRDPRSPLRIEREPPVRYSMADWRRRESEHALTHAKREHAVRRYADHAPPPPPPRLNREQAVQFAELERRTRALEQEVRVLRTQRDAALRHVEHRDASRVYHQPPPRYREAEAPYERNAARRNVNHRYVDPDR